MDPLIVRDRLDRWVLLDQQDRKVVRDRLAQLDHREILVPPVLKEIQARLGQRAILVRRGRKVTLVLPDLADLLDQWVHKVIRVHKVT